MAGFATLRVKGLAAGTAITLRYGEVLQVSNSLVLLWRPLIGLGSSAAVSQAFRLKFP